MNLIESPRKDAATVLHCGIDCLDERLGGLLAGRTYLLTGAPGTGKTVACLEFLNRGLAGGERCAILTVDDPADVIAQGEFLGLELEQALADERLILLRYQLDFARRFSRTPSPADAFAELRSLLGDSAPDRLAIDSVAPLLEAGQASGAGFRALVRCLEELGATTMIAVPGDLSVTFDRRMEPLVQRAAAILHFSVDREGERRIELQKVRFPVASTSPIRCRIQAGAGIMALDERQRRADDRGDQPRRKLLLLDLSRSFPAAMVDVLRRRLDVEVRHEIVGAFSSLALMEHGGVLIDVHRDSVDEALKLVRELRLAGDRSPIMLVTSFRLRSNDRARALRAGADEFLSSDLPPDEFILRVETAIRRGRSFATPVEREVPIPMQPAADGGGWVPLGDDDFRDAIRTHVEHDPLPFFTVVTVRPRDGGEVDSLAAIALDNIRTGGGDLAGVVDGGVAVYLHSARRKDVSPFVDRVRAAWLSARRGELDIVTATWPADEARIEELIGATEHG